MANLYQAGKGGVLADEMGLGKTVQACALLSGIPGRAQAYLLECFPILCVLSWKSIVLGFLRQNIIWKLLRNDSGVILEILEIDSDHFLM